jgi:hypothetical protein
MPVRGKKICSLVMVWQPNLAAILLALTSSRLIDARAGQMRND